MGEEQQLVWKANLAKWRLICGKLALEKAAQF